MSIPHLMVREDVVDILLNLKGVVLKLHGRDSVVLSLKKDGEGAVLAGDIELPHDVEVINPDHVICHISSGGKIDMEIKIEKAAAISRCRFDPIMKTTVPSVPFNWMLPSRRFAA